MKVIKSRDVILVNIHGLNFQAPNFKNEILMGR